MVENRADMNPTAAHGAFDEQMTVQPEALPGLAYDGTETILANALLPYAVRFAGEMDAALEQEMAENSQRPTVGNFESVGDYLDWLNKNPRPTVQVERKWYEWLGIQPTNNLYLLFTVDSNGDPRFETDLSRQYLAALESEDAQFVAAARTASQDYIERLLHEASLAKEASLPAAERHQLDVRRWICYMYAAEAQDRFRNMGATDEELERLRN